MKFTKLLKIISEDNGDTKKAIEKLHDQQEEIAKNFHFINVLELTKKLNYMINKKVFQKSNICSCVITFDIIRPYDEDEEINRSIKISFLSLKGKPMSSPYCDKGGDDLSYILERFNNYNPNFMGEEINSDDLYPNTYKFELKKDCIRDIYELLLSKQIRLEIDYSRMTNDLNTDIDIEQKNTNKKLKI
jgi:hypothetical protein